MNSARYDAVVVGSGFGGALVARELAAAGLNTALLERGQWARRDDADWDQQKILVEQRYKSAAPMLVRQHGGKTFAKIYPNEVVGGNSVFYGGASLRLRPGDFVRWPFAYEDLAAHYARVERILGVHGEAGADPYEPPGIASYPHDAVEFSAPAQRVYAAGSALGLRPFKIPLALSLIHI